MNKKAMIVVGIVLVVLIGAGATYILTQKHPTSNKSDDSSTVATADAPSKKFSDACKVFTQEQIATAFGGAFGAGEEESATTSVSASSPKYDDLKGSACRYTQVNDGTTVGITGAFNVTVSITNYETIAGADAYMSSLHDPQSAEGQAATEAPIDVENLGDQAFFATLSMPYAANDKTDSLYIREGRQIILIASTRLTGVDHQTNQASLVNLAKNL